MRRAVPALRLMLVFVAIACGSSSITANSPSDPGTGTANGSSVNGTGTVSASVNGTAWTSDLATVTINRLYGTRVFIVSTSSTYAIGFGVQNATGTGTFALPASGTDVATGLITNAGRGWSTGLNGGSGTVTITVFTSSRIAGTFSFDAQPMLTGTTGVMHVTNGKFDMTY